LSAASSGKRVRNGVPVAKKPIPVCTFCSKLGHNAVDCWNKLDADQAKHDRLLNILSLAVLLKAEYEVEFRVGTDLDPTDGGDL
jgi:hypothetical protein